MSQNSYPALYTAADNASNRAQSNFLRCIKSYALILIIGAGLSIYGIESKISAVLAALVFFIGLFLSIFMAFKRFENAWYSRNVES